MSAGATPALSPRAVAACAAVCGAMVANIFYAQPLVAPISPQLGLAPGVGGLIVTLTQLGYGAGLLLIVPLADRIENRRLIVVTLLLSAAALAGLAAAPSASSFLAASVLVGVCSAGAQVVVPFAASLAPEATRGRTIGNVMAGLLTGIMLARPIAGLVADLAGWRAVFWLSCGLMTGLAAWVGAVLPERRPASGERYGQILRSMGRILVDTPALQRRALYQGVVFAVFNLFWTAAPLMLSSRFGLSQRGIAFFALAGAGGALAAPFAGRLGDRGHVRSGTAAALIVVAAACALAGWAGSIGSLALMVLFALLLDAASQTNQVLGQRVIYSLPGEARGRLNAVYMTIVFLLGAGGSALATLTFQHAGWRGAMAAGAAMGLAVLAVFATEYAKARRPARPRAPVRRQA